MWKPGIYFHDSGTTGTNVLAIRDFNSPDLSDASFPTGKNSRKAPTESATAMPTIAPISAHGNPWDPLRIHQQWEHQILETGWIKLVVHWCPVTYVYVPVKYPSINGWFMLVESPANIAMSPTFEGWIHFFWMFKSHYNVPFQDIFPFSNKAHIILLLLVCPVKYTHDVLWFGSWIHHWPKQKYCILVT